MSADGTTVQDIQTDTAEWLRSERNKRDALAAHYERAGDEEVAQLHRSVVARYDFALAAVSRPAEARGEAFAALREAVYGREVNDPDETPRYVMLRVKHAAALYQQLAAPRPEPGEVTEAMVERVMRHIAQLAGLTDKGWANLTDSERAELRLEAEGILTAALSVQREQTP